MLRRVYVLPYLAVMEQREEPVRHRPSSSPPLPSRSLRDADLQAETLLSRGGDRRGGPAHGDRVTRRRLPQGANRQAASLAVSQLLEAGRAGLRETRDKERCSVKEQAVECVALACDQLLGTSDSETIEATVDRLMERTAR